MTGSNSPTHAPSGRWVEELTAARDERLRNIARVTHDNGRDYDARAFLGMRVLFGADVVTIDSWRANGGLAARSVLDGFEPGRGWFTPADRQREEATERIARLESDIRIYQEAIDGDRCLQGGYSCTSESRCAYCVRQREVYRGYVAQWSAELERLQAELNGTTYPTPAAEPPVQDKTDGEAPEEDEEGCLHTDARCYHCEGRPDHQCDHSYGCECSCGDEHDRNDCTDCGYEPDCRHRWDCQDCDETDIEPSGGS